MTNTVTGLYDHYASAQAAVGELERMGIPHSDISIVAHGRDTGHASDAADDAGKGAGIGAAVGGLGGLLTGLGMMAIPGVGPVVAAGWLVATAVGAAGGAAVGGAAGGLIGSMTNAGVNESDAHVYAEGVRRGGTLVTARVDDSKVAAANAVLHRNKAVDPVARGDAYRTQGWTRFDETAHPYSETETASERARYTVR
jgi:hypothetical protein